MKIAVISFTRRGNKLNLALLQELRKAGHEAEGFCRCSAGLMEELKGFEAAKILTEELFYSREGLIYIGACGIAVRSIAPFLAGKDKDPCVLVMDEAGKYVISLLSGHLGGGNRLCLKVAEMTGAAPVITTATDINCVFAVDLFAQKNNLIITELPMIKEISAALLDGRPVGISVLYPVKGELPEGLHQGEEGVGIHIGTDRKAEPYSKTLHLVPRNLVLGIGCKRGITGEALTLRVRECFRQAGLEEDRIVKICSVDLKKTEPGIHQLAKDLKAELVFYTPEELGAVKGEFQASAFVKETAGVDNVCERSAALGSGCGKVRLSKTTGGGIALAVYEKDCIIEF